MSIAIIFVTDCCFVISVELTSDNALQCSKQNCKSTRNGGLLGFTSIYLELIMTDYILVKLASRWRGKKCMRQIMIKITKIHAIKINVFTKPVTASSFKQ